MIHDMNVHTVVYIRASSSSDIAQTAQRYGVAMRQPYVRSHRAVTVGISTARAIRRRRQSRPSQRPLH